jgi:predicted lipoprotein
LFKEKNEIKYEEFKKFFNKIKKEVLRQEFKRYDIEGKHMITIETFTQL